MFIWSCAIYRFLQNIHTYTHTLALTPGYTQQASRNLHKCMSHDRSCLYIINKFLLCSRTGSFPQEQKTKVLS